MIKQIKQLMPVVLGAVGVGFVFFQLTLPRPEPTIASRMVRREVELLLATTLPTTTMLYNEKLIEFRRNANSWSAVCPRPAADGHWRVPYVPRALRTSHWADPQLIEHIRQCWILPLTVRRANHSVSRPPKHDRNGSRIDELLGRRTEGFFVEWVDGAKAGIPESLFFERRWRNWTGLLVAVGPPRRFAELIRRASSDRNCFVSNACLSPGDRATVMQFERVNGSLVGAALAGRSGRGDPDEATGYGESFTLQCFPLASMLKALNVTRVHLTSLRVEGSEYGILSWLPYDEVIFEAFVVRYRVTGDRNATKANLERIRKLMVNEGRYKELATTPDEEILLINRK